MILMILLKPVDCADPSCSGRGKCLHGECHCSRGWTGTSCEKKEVLQVNLIKLFNYTIIFNLKKFSVSSSDDGKYE